MTATRLLSLGRVTADALRARDGRTTTLLVGSFYIYDEAGNHRGPIALDALVREIRAKQVAEDALVAPERWFEAPGTSGWHRADEVSEIKEALAAESAGDLRIVEGAFKTNRLGTPEFGATVMMVGSARRGKNEP